MPYWHLSVPIVALEHKSRIQSTCESPAFEFNITHVDKSEFVPWYIKWTQTELPRLRRDQETEFVTVQRELWGSENGTCSIANHGCTNLPTCRDIGEGMGLDHTKELESHQRVELRRRYFLKLAIEYHMGYLYAHHVSLMPNILINSDNIRRRDSLFHTPRWRRNWNKSWACFR